MIEHEHDVEFQAAYLHAFKRLRRIIAGLAVALVLLGCASGYAIYDAGQQRVVGHNDTQNQIRTLACSVVDQIPPDHGTADATRTRYDCGPYTPPRAVVQPKPGVVSTP